MYGDWFLQDLPGRLQKLRDEPIAGLATFLEGLNEEEQLALVRAWILDYRLRMSKLAKVLEQPYWTARERIREISAEAEKEAAALKTDPRAGNALVATLMPVLARVAGQFAEAEARLAMARIACAAMLSKARDGACPPDLDALKPFFPKGLPKDPFTGKDCIYRLEDGLPRVECKGPERLSLDVAGAREKDDAEPAEDEPF